MAVHLERDESIVFGRDEQGRYADAVEKAHRGLSGVVIVGCAEAERRRGDVVVERIDRVPGGEVGFGISAGGDEAQLHAVHEAPLVKVVIPLVDALSGEGEIDGSGDGADALDEVGCAEFAGEFEGDVASEGEAGEEAGKRCLGLFEEASKV